MAAMAIMMGGYVRIGMEDNTLVRRRQMATNAELVQKAARLTHELEREVATPDEMRTFLGLNRAAAVKF